MDLIERQLKREFESVTDGTQAYWKSVRPDSVMKGAGSPLLTKPERKAIGGHIAVFAQAIATQFPTDPLQFSKLHRSWSPAFKAQVIELFSKVAYDEAAFGVLKYAIRYMFVNEKKYNYAAVCRPTADEIIKQYHFKQFEGELPGYVNALKKSLKTRNEDHRHKVLTVKRHEKGITDFDMEDREKVVLGGTLLHIMCESTGLFEFSEIMDHETKLPTMVLKATDQFKDWLEKQHDLYSELQPIDVPMVCKPKPWTGLYDGGFLSNNARMKQHPIVKVRDKELRATAFERVSPEVLEGLNALQEMPWSINEPILEVLEQIKVTGSGLGGVPWVPRDERIPVKPWEGTGMDKEQFQKEHKEEYTKWRNAAAAEYTRFYNEASARSTFLMQLAVAREFAQEPRFYFCYNMDWRGRVYILQNCGLTPQGDDVSKALLQFADAKPLGERGVFWLGVHIANSFGFDKASFDERYQWTISHHQEILAAVQDPFEMKWWTDADKPFMFLVACMEWAKAHELSDPTLFESKLPIGMDASCSGSQHFSGLLLDEVGGKAVNLVPSEKPSDIYALVAEKSIAIMQAEGKPESVAWLNIEGGFNRKWTKRNTMTMPYSASLYGFTDQLVEELGKEGRKHNKSMLTIPAGMETTQSKWDFACARYLAEVNRRAISQVVVKMFEAMQWLRGVAGAAAKTGQDITWETPVGLKVVQRYRKSTAKQLQLWFGGIQYKPSISTETLKPNTEGHMNGISPNFIHSMDAAHLIKIAAAFRRQGAAVTCPAGGGMPRLCLGVVHDSFGCHACDVELMRGVIRGEFVKLYAGKDHLYEFYLNLKANNPTLDIEPPPSRGKLDISCVEESPYFIS